MGQIRISAKNLGAIALEDFCPRCFWLQLKLKFRFPYQIFPGIFSSIDAYNKRVVHGWFDKHGKAPDWLSEIGEIRGYKEPPHYSKFNVVIPEYDILLTGAPDAIFLQADNSHVIVDYKTAKYTGTQDKLFPMYEAQLNAYAYIGQRVGYRPVSGLALLYMEPITEVKAGELDEIISSHGFLLDFHANLHPIELNPGSISPLLQRCRTIGDMEAPPTSSPHCRECVLVEQMLSVLT